MIYQLGLFESEANFYISKTLKVAISNKEYSSQGNICEGRGNIEDAMRKEYYLHPNLTPQEFSQSFELGIYDKGTLQRLGFTIIYPLMVYIFNDITPSGKIHNFSSSLKKEKNPQAVEIDLE